MINIDDVINRLKARYPKVNCTLDYEKNPYRLLVMARLSAQCTDARVNIVCGKLFGDYPSIDDIISLDIETLEKYVYSCGLYKTKARDIKNMSVMIKDDFDGKVPDNMDDLLKLPGVGRKIANLILGDVYGQNAVVTDTHCIRIANRLGFVNSKNPVVVEKELLKIIPVGEAVGFCHRLVEFGREICKAQNPDCKKCFLLENKCEL